MSYGQEAQVQTTTLRLDPRSTTLAVPTQWSMNEGNAERQARSGLPALARPVNAGRFRTTQRASLSLRTRCRGLSADFADKHEIGAAPKRSGDAPARARGQNDVVIAGNSQIRKNRGRNQRLHYRQIGEEPINIRIAIVARRGEGYLGILCGKVPAQGRGRRHRALA